MKTKSHANDKSLDTLEDWLNWLETLHPKEIDFGLDRIRCVLDKLSLVELPFRTITVGGTNGKGSCVAMLDNIYRCAGYRVGTFTSPHLWRFNERICFDGQEICDEPLIELFRCIENARGLITLSYFEYSVVAALLHFVRNKAELALLEVGLGGRLDAVNAIDADASLVVSVELDHQDWLGKDRESIGREKAGIFRSDRPAVVADRSPPESLLIHAQQLGSSLQLIGRDFDGSGTWGSWNYKGWGLSKENLPTPSFGGQEQLDNMAGCLAIIESMDEHLPVELPVISRGLSTAQIAGRTDRHVRGGVEWIFDVAHNPAAARVFSDAVIQLPSPGYTWAILAIMKDKDLSGVVAPFMGVVDQWIVTSTGSERSVNAEILGGLMKTEGASNVRSLADAVAACKLVDQLAEPGHRVLVFGSFYLVGPAMTALALYSAPSQAGRPISQMDRHLKERLIGAIVLVVIGVWLIPWLLDGTDQRDDGTELGSSGMDSIREQTQTMVQTILLGSNHGLGNQRNAIALEEAQSPLNGNLLSPSTTLASQSPESESASQSPGNSASAPSIFIQVGSFGDRENARRLMERVENYGFDPQISTYSAGGGVMYRVRIGPEFSQSGAERVASSLSSHGFLVQIVGDE